MDDFLQQILNAGRDTDRLRLRREEAYNKILPAPHASSLDEDGMKVGYWRISGGVMKMTRRRNGSWNTSTIQMFRDLDIEALACAIEQPVFDPIEAPLPVAPLEQFEIKGRGTVFIVDLGELLFRAPRKILVDGKVYRVSAVEHQGSESTVGLVVSLEGNQDAAV